MSMVYMAPGTVLAIVRCGYILLLAVAYCSAALLMIGSQALQQLLQAGLPSPF